MNKVLLIEDDKNIRETVYEILQQSGYDVTTAENGLIGINEAKKVIPDLVICDIMMPVLDGWKTIELFRSIDKFENTPFVFLSGMSLTPNYRLGMNRGADDYLVKPIETCELLDIVDRLISKSIKMSLANDARVINALNTFEGEIKSKEKDHQDSLNRAKIVQEGILPSEAKMKGIFENHFLYYNPLETISGDFYWTKQLKGIKLIAVADCTGHGVPAALLSMACATMLNVAFDLFEITSPAQALYKVNDLISEFMRENNLQYSGDGMDISLCAIDTENNLVTYAGAKRPLYFIPKVGASYKSEEGNIKTHQNTKGDKLIEFKGGAYSIGSDDFEIEESSFNFKQGDNLYLFSDGYVSQFGGNKSKKFNSMNLKRLLLSIQDREIKQQGVELRNSFELWKGDEEQTDDVTIIGITL